MRAIRYVGGKDVRLWRDGGGGVGGGGSCRLVALLGKHYRWKKTRVMVLTFDTSTTDYEFSSSGAEKKIRYILTREVIHLTLQHFILTPKEDDLLLMFLSVKMDIQLRDPKEEYG